MEKERKASLGNTERYDLEILLRRPSLRASIPRRVSQVCREPVSSEETTCGIGCLKGRWLQSFANRTCYIFIYGTVGSFCGSYYAYFYSVITTLEKRFKISSLTMGIIASSGDIAGVMTCYLLSLCMPKVHRPKIIGLGVLLMVASTLIFTLPHFLDDFISKNFPISTDFDISQFKNENNYRHCIKSGQTCTEGSHSENGTIIILFLAQILHGFGRSLYFISGKKYEDDNIDKHQPFAMQSFVSVLRILGLAFGYWLSSISLKIFEYPTLMSESAEGEPHWIGAWWLGSLVIGFILIVPGFLITLFPTTLPKTAVRRIYNRSTSSSPEIGREKPTALKMLFINTTFNCTNFGGIFNIVGFMAYFFFLPKYTEIQFRVSPSNANFISGSLTLISSTVGMVAANSAITRYRPSARTLASWTVIIGILSIGGLISYMHLGCEENDYEINAMITRHLNSTCQCNSYPFLPVCDEYGQSFISPCHSDCDIFYFNHTEGSGGCYYTQKPSNFKKIFKGFCSVDCQFNFLKFTFLTCLLAFMYATSCTTQFLFDAKFEETQKKFSLNSKMTFLCLLATTLAPIVFGYILDDSCLLWKGHCTKSGNCWLYDNEKLRFYMNLVAVGFAALKIIFDLGVWFSVKNLELFDKISYYNDENNE